MLDLAPDHRGRATNLLAAKAKGLGLVALRRDPSINLEAEVGKSSASSLTLRFKRSSGDIAIKAYDGEDRAAPNAWLTRSRCVDGEASELAFSARATQSPACAIAGRCGTFVAGSLIHEEECEWGGYLRNYYRACGSPFLATYWWLIGNLEDWTAVISKNDGALSS
ncbi:MAG: hypothetical protein AAF401_03115 [Pseudomonadota bacterium]